jgi:hypothetical protein
MASSTLASSDTSPDLVLEPPYFTVVPHHLVPGTSWHLVGTPAVASCEWQRIHFTGKILSCPVYIKACVDVIYVRTMDLAYFEFVQRVAHQGRAYGRVSTPDLVEEPPYFTRVLIEFVPRTIWHLVGTSPGVDLQTIYLVGELIGCPIYIKAWVEVVYVRTEDLVYFDYVQRVSQQVRLFRSLPTTRCTPAPPHRW